jgi:hypothetical protein
MKQPVKIIFDDGSEEEWNDSDVLEYVDDDEIRSYAEWDLDMESDCGDDEKDIDDFETNEILDELFHRYNIHKDIISMRRFEEFLTNFYTI